MQDSVGASGLIETLAHEIRVGPPPSKAVAIGMLWALARGHAENQVCCALRCVIMSTILRKRLSLLPLPHALTAFQ